MYLSIKYKQIGYKFPLNLVKEFSIKYSKDVIDVVIIQPPMVQLNTPYPSGAYLLSFFKNLLSNNQTEGNVAWLDLSTELFHRVFSQKGILHIFEKTFSRALKLADDFERKGDDGSAFQIRRFISQSKLWADWIEKIVSIVCSNGKVSGREFTHEFVRSAHVPRGNRVEQFLSKLERDVSVDDSQILASLALADLADYISVVYDKNFALIRYAESLATSTSTFSQVENELSSPILIDFLQPLLEEKLSNITRDTLFCVSVPFPGTFTAGLFIAKYLKNRYSKNALVAMGGGYVNTELRTVKENKLFDYCDFLSYDKGYGSYIKLFENAKYIEELRKKLDGSQYYKIKYAAGGNIIEPLENDSEIERAEKNLVRTLVPDFESIDFTKSPRLADSNNPMHRIWNDGAWIKLYLAYGCYWHRCAFCDTSLDYVKGFCGTNISALYDGIYRQCQKAGVYGLHFVDEACPPIGLQEFALKNIAAAKNGTSLTYWGNIRFEKTFSRDLADLLSYGGMTAVSGGIEIATGNGLDSINKGTDMENIVAACCAFKEAGILVHSYMIFGFWNQTEQDLIDSMETLRQLFAAGLLDSAFWHKFSLTLHSTVYREWLEGKHPELKPIVNSDTQFAENSIQFEGEEKSEKYSAPLNAALDMWMNGEKLKKNVESFFPYKMPRPSIPADYVERLIEKYERKRDNSFKEIGKGGDSGKFVWIGGKVFTLKAPGGKQLCWSYMGELIYADVNKDSADSVCKYINSISAENFFTEEPDCFTAQRIIDSIGKKLFFELRGKGLCSLI